MEASYEVRYQWKTLRMRRWVNDTRYFDTFAAARERFNALCDSADSVVRNVQLFKVVKLS
jgi:hypothetical protein